MKIYRSSSYDVWFTDSGIFMLPGGVNYAAEVAVVVRNAEFRRKPKQAFIDAAAEAASGGESALETWVTENVTPDAELRRTRLFADAYPSAGRPARMNNGGRVNVYLDEASISTACKLGGGNVSEGIRKALAAMHDSVDSDNKGVTPAE